MPEKMSVAERITEELSDATIREAEVETEAETWG